MTRSRHSRGVDKRPWKHWPFAILIVLPLLIYWPLTIGGRVLYWGVPLFQFHPWHTIVVEAIRSGHLPLWTDLLANGTPLLANHQSATFYPPNLMYFAVPVERAMGYSVVLHLIMAGLFAYAWGRVIRLSRFGAMVTGLTFMLSGFMVSRTQFITIVNGAAWLPLLFLLAERLVRRRTFLDAIWLGVVMALQFLAGHAQLWFYSLWVVGAYALVRGWSASEKGPGTYDGSAVRTGPRRWHILALLAGAFFLSLGLSAVQLLPTGELSLLSQRADGLNPDEAMTYSFWPWRLLTLAVPDLFGSPATGDYWGYATYWEDAGYIGVLPLLFALGAVWGWGSRRLSSRVRERRGESQESDAQEEKRGPHGLLVTFFLALILFSLVMAMGKNTPLYPFFFKYVPGFGAFRAPARFLLYYTFGISTLAGIGAYRFQYTYRTQYVARLTVAGAGAMLAVSLLIGQMGLMIKPTFAPAFARFAVLLGLSAGLLLLGSANTTSIPVQAGPDEREPGDLDPRLARSPLPPWVWRALVIGLIAVDLALFAVPLTPTIDSALYTSMTNADRYLLARADSDRIFATYDYDAGTKFDRYFDFADWGSPDLAHWLSFRETLVPNLTVLSRSLSVNNDDPLVVGRWRVLIDTLRNADWPERLRVLQLMNVGYVLAESPPPGLMPAADVDHLYRLSRPLPRAWMVPQAHIMVDPEEVLLELMAANFDPTAEVLLEAGPHALKQLDGSDSNDGVRTVAPQLSESSPDPQIISLREEGNSRTINLVVSQPGYLVLAYTHYPGWSATVDGRPTEILRANYAFMALPIGPGEHQVIVSYRPMSLTVGAVVSGLSLLAVIGIVGLGSVRKSLN